jgi:hypothetical protein
MTQTIYRAQSTHPLFTGVPVADTFTKRLIGLMLRPAPSPDRALIFYNTNSIHTCFMRFAIDIVFFDKNFKVLRIIPNTKPFRFTFTKDAYGVIECLGGAAIKKEIKPGDMLVFKND